MKLSKQQVNALRYLFRMPTSAQPYKGRPDGRKEHGFIQTLFSLERKGMARFWGWLPEMFNKKVEEAEKNGVLTPKLLAQLRFFQDCDPIWWSGEWTLAEEIGCEGQFWTLTPEGLKALVRLDQVSWDSSKERFSLNFSNPSSCHVSKEGLQCRSHLQHGVKNG